MNANDTAKNAATDKGAAMTSMSDTNGAVTPRFPEASQLQDLVVAAQHAFDNLRAVVVHPDDAPRDGYSLFVAVNLFNSRFFAAMPGFLDGLAGLHGLLPGGSGSEECDYTALVPSFPEPLELSNLAAMALNSLAALEKAVPSPHYFSDWQVPEPEGYAAVLCLAVGVRIWNASALEVKTGLEYLLGALPAPTVELRHGVHPVKNWQPKSSDDVGDDDIPF